MLFDKCYNYTKCCNNIHSNLMKILEKIRKQNCKGSKPL